MTQAPGTVRTIAYLRVSTQGQGDSGAGLDAQRTAIEAEAQHRGWSVTLVTEVASGGSLTGRPLLSDALDALDRGDADVLCVSKMDRLSRSVADFAALHERARRHGWHIHCMDLGVDISTPAGEFVANTMASVSQLERRLISARTKDALAAKRAQGVRLGRPVALCADVRDRIVSDRDRGLSLQAIADALTSEGVPTARGGRWFPSTIAGVLRSVEHDRVACRPL